jgi:hypothetical protein
MSSLQETLLPNAKIADLRKSTVEPSSGSRLTTDHGVAVSDTDNWYMLVKQLLYRTKLTNTLPNAG